MFSVTIRLPSSPFSPLQPLMPFPSIPGSPIRCERKDDKTKILHTIVGFHILSSLAFQLLLIGIASFNVLAISPVFIRHSALLIYFARRIKISYHQRYTVNGNKQALTNNCFTIVSKGSSNAHPWLLLVQEILKYTPKSAVIRISMNVHVY